MLLQMPQKQQTAGRPRRQTGKKEADSQKAESGEAVTITLVESLTSPERTAVLREIADKYQAEHSNITIDIISPPLENADAKITQMLMNGSGADIVEVRDSTVTQYATNEWIADLQKYIDAWDEKGTLTESADEVIHYLKGGAYLIPYGFYQRGLFYRADWFEEKGLDQPETWQDIYDAGLAITDPANSRFGYSFRGGPSGYQYADTIYWSWIGTDKVADPNAAYFLKDGDGATIFTLPEVKEALHFYKEHLSHGLHCVGILRDGSGLCGRYHSHADSGSGSNRYLFRRHAG